MHQNVKVCKSANVQVCKYASMQMTRGGEEGGGGLKVGEVLGEGAVGHHAYRFRFLIFGNC